MKILVISGHPNKASFCQALAEKYQAGALSAGHEVKFINLRDLQFNPNFTGQSELESDLLKAQELIKWSEHLVIVSPVWWLSLPSLLKGFIDRTLTPGFAYKFLGRMRWTRLLKGRSVRFIYTQGSPQLIYRLFLADSFWRSVKVGIFGYCGFNPVRRTVFSEVPISSPKKRESWLNKVYNLGKKGI